MYPQVAVHWFVQPEEQLEPVHEVELFEVPEQVPSQSPLQVLEQYEQEDDPVDVPEQEPSQSPEQPELQSSAHE